MTLSELRKRVAAAQKRMGLSDWKLTVEWMEPDGERDADMYVISLHEKEAALRFVRPKRGCSVANAVLLHELSHIYFAPFYIPPNDLNEERACWAIAHALDTK